MRSERKVSHLTQQDLSLLFDVKDNTKFSRVESGLQKIDTETMLIYHLLFDIPIFHFFKDEREKIRNQFRKKAPQLLHLLDQLEPSPRIERRQNHLISLLKCYEHFS